MSSARFTIGLTLMLTIGMATEGCAQQRLPDEIPAAGRVDTGTFSGPEGTRAYRLHLPPGGNGAARPLLVLLHGCTQTAEDFARGAGLDALADASGMLVLYPEQPASANPLRCWNWFDAAHQQRGAGEPALLAAMTADVAARHGADPRRVYVAGVSAGAAMALVLAAGYPERFAAAGAHSGVPLRAANPATALQVMRTGGIGDPAALRAAHGGAPPARLVPLIVVHGAADAVVHVANARATFDQWTGAARSAGLTLELASDSAEAGGLSYRRTTAGAPAAPLVELWVVDELGHAWSGGNPAGSYADPRGPSAARELLRFLLSHAQPEADR